jgi:oxygen-dependent protoporphyrinogen oxidase
MNRRDFLSNFLKLSATWGAAGPLLSCAPTLSRSISGIRSADDRFRAKKAIVIGAGIAGLSAAYFLKKAGVDVEVFESEKVVGGRMSNSFRDGIAVDRGAQFFSSSSPTLIPLLNELDLSREVLMVDSTVEIVRGNRIHGIETGQVLSILTGGTLDFGGITQLHLLKLQSWLQRAKQLPRDDYSAWSDLDTETASELGQRIFGEQGSQYLVEPLLSGLFFNEPEETSAALLAWTLEFFLEAKELRTFRDGMSTLPIALSKRVNVHTSARAEQVFQRGESVFVRMANETLQADWVVVAVPAPIARGLISPAQNLENQVLATDFVPALNIILKLKLGWKAGRKAFGTLIPRTQRGLISSIVSNPRGATASGNELLQILISAENSPDLMNCSDSEILIKISPEIDRYYADCSKNVEDIEVVRWTHAMPFSPVGRASALLRYRQNLANDRRILLAGDSYGIPGADSAAQTGIWAAARILGNLGM